MINKKKVQVNIIKVLFQGKTNYKVIRLRGKNLFFNVKPINLSGTQYIKYTH